MMGTRTSAWKRRALLDRLETAKGREELTHYTYVTCLDLNPDLDEDERRDAVAALAAMFRTDAGREALVSFVLLAMGYEMNHEAKPDFDRETADTLNRLFAPDLVDAKGLVWAHIDDAGDLEDATKAGLVEWANGVENVVGGEDAYRLTDEGEKLLRDWTLR